MATQGLATARQSGLRAAALRKELFSWAAAAGGLLLIFVSVSVGSGPLHQPLHQNC